MPRKGWTTVEVPDVWLQIIRGPRPPAAKWLRAKAQSTPEQRPSTTVAHRQPLSPNQMLQMQDRPRRSPFGSRIVSCPTSSCDPSSRQAHRRYVSFHCTGEKRIAAGSAKIEQAEQRQVLEELAQAEKDLECFRREAETAQTGGSGGCRWESQDPVTALEAELSQVRAELAQLKGGVDPDAPCGPSVKRPCRTGEVRGAIPAMPTLVPAELNLWLEERHADLHEALLKGDSNRALELTALSDGVKQMVEMTGGMLP